MKALKRIAALMLAGVMAASLTACLHKKGEIAVTVGDTEFTSAYYMCALIYAEAEAESKIYEELSDEEKNSEDIDYLSKKIDKKSFTDWVEDRAIEVIKNHAAYMLLCEKDKITRTEEELKELETNVEQSWEDSNYGGYTYTGAKSTFEPNGVSYETYKSYVINSQLAEKYFDYIYGKEGTKAILRDALIKEITDNYLLVDKISITYGEDDDDAEKAESKAKLEGYAKEISSGKKSFVEIYKAHNEITDEETDEDKTDAEELVPVNTYANVIGNDKTTVEDENFDTYKKYEFDVPKVTENSDKTGVELVIKRDFEKDEYFIDYLDSTVRHSIADEDFDKLVQKQVDELKADISKYAISQFKVKKIVASK